MSFFLTTAYKRSKASWTTKPRQAALLSQVCIIKEGAGGCKLITYVNQSTSEQTHNVTTPPTPTTTLHMHILNEEAFLRGCGNAGARRSKCLLTRCNNLIIMRKPGCKCSRCVHYAGKKHRTKQKTKRGRTAGRERLGCCFFFSSLVT